MKKTEFTLEDYKKFLKKESKLLEEKAKEVKKELSYLTVFCYTKEKNGITYVYSDITNIYLLLNKTGNKIKFKEALKAIYGADFFSEYTKEEKKFCEEKGLFTKEDLDEILKPVYGSKYGYNLKKPNNYNELYDFIIACFEIFNDIKINQKSKEEYFSILYSVAKLMEISCKQKLDGLYKINKKIDIYNMFVSAYDKKINLELTEDKENEIIEILSNDERKFITLNEEDNNQILSFSDTYLLFSKNLNEYLKEEKENKENKKLNKKVDKYFNKISKKSIDKLDNSYFPNYDDDEYSKIINLLLQKFNGKEDLLDYYTVLIMYHAGSFNEKYSDLNNSVKSKKEGLIN